MMSKPNFRSEVVESKGVEYFKMYHNPKSEQAQIATITPEKAKNMIATLQEYLENQK
jgi:hypothetical protein